MDRRSVDEVLTRYTLEPSLFDVYVEGSHDRRLIDWVLSRSATSRSVSVYEIDTVDVPSSLLERMALTSSNRNRVIALARVLTEEFPERALRVTCIADSDFDLLLGRRRSCDYLAYSDYSSMDLYGWTEATVAKIIQVGLGLDESLAEPIYSSVNAAAAKLFAIRGANESLSWNMKWISPKRCCSVSQGGIALDCDEFIRRYLTNNSAIGRETIFQETYSGLLDSMVLDPKHYVRGHDIEELLAVCLGRLLRGSSRRIVAGPAMRALLRTSLEYSDLQDEPLFRHLLGGSGS